GGRHNGTSAGPGRGVAAPPRQPRADALPAGPALALAQAEPRQAGTRADGTGRPPPEAGPVPRQKAEGGGRRGADRERGARCEGIPGEAQTLPAEALAAESVRRRREGRP